jgi:hypothetical protein
MIHTQLTESAQTACYRALGNQLLAADSAFGSKVFARFHPFSINPAEQDFPYVVMVIVGGGERNQIKKPDAEFTVQVACYADSATVSEEAARVIDNALNDKGQQESNASDSVSGGNQWYIATITGGRVVTNVEYYENAARVFVDGKVYRVTMEVS